ncbi:MAG: exosortase/archaeosortase family protein [Puniceicoccales bacterium]|jgi:exosortase/archaeosortase family protein|nr:exosortase/archaeosortase family protein [Puniceicoccales bacterium]
MQNTSTPKLDRAFIPAAAFLLGCLGIVIWDQCFQWHTREDYNFGFLVPFCFGYVLYDRWPAIRATLLGTAPEPSPAPPPAGRHWDTLVYAGLALALPLFGLGAAMRAISGPGILATWFNTFGFISIFLGLAWTFSKENAAGRALSFKERSRFIALFAFPALVWFISGPMLYLMDTQIKILLLREVTSAVVNMLGWVDINLTQEGNVILLPQVLPGGQHDSVGVADACSGIRSLTACTFMGAFLSATFLHGPVRKILLLAASLIFALLLNVLRTGFLTLWAFKKGSAALSLDLWGAVEKLPNGVRNPEFTLGTVHDIAGYIAMGMTFMLLLAMLPVLNANYTRRTPETHGDEPEK